MTDTDHFIETDVAQIGNPNERGIVTMRIKVKVKWVEFWKWWARRLDEIEH